MNAEKNIMQGLDMAVAQAIDDPDNTEIQVSLVDFRFCKTCFYLIAQITVSIAIYGIMRHCFNYVMRCALGAGGWALCALTYTYI